MEYYERYLQSLVHIVNKICYITDGSCFIDLCFTCVD